MGQRSYSRSTSAVGVAVALGIWLILCPFVLGFSTNRTAKWNDVAAGVAVAVLAVGGAGWWNAGIGIWLIVSYFILGLGGAPAILWNNVILGALVTIVALAGSSKAQAESLTSR